MYDEIVIAHSYDHAVDWAAEKNNWSSCNLSPTGQELIPGFTTDEGKKIIFIGDLVGLRRANPGTKVHFGPFPEGIPAELLLQAMEVSNPANARSIPRSPAAESVDLQRFIASGEWHKPTDNPHAGRRVVVREIDCGEHQESIIHLTYASRIGFLVEIDRIPKFFIHDYRPGATGDVRSLSELFHALGPVVASQSDDHKG